MKLDTEVLEDMTEKKNEIKEEIQQLEIYRETVELAIIELESAIRNVTVTQTQVIW